MSIKNQTNAEFAHAIGVQPSNISHILSGRNKPSLDLIMKIVKRYPEIRLDWLLQGDGSMNKEFGSDLFSVQNVEHRSGEKEIASNKAEISGQRPDKIHTGPAFEVKNGQESVKTAQEQRDTSIAKDSEDYTNYVPSSEMNTKSATEVAKIVIFYSDNTFRVYTPG